MAKIYDAVVVGSGAAGGMAATELCLKGLKVLMLERGPKFNIATDFEHHRKPYNFPFRGRVRPSERAMYNYTADEWNKKHFVNELENPYTGKSLCGCALKPSAARRSTGDSFRCASARGISRPPATTASVPTGPSPTKMLHPTTARLKTGSGFAAIRIAWRTIRTAIFFPHFACPVPKASSGGRLKANWTPGR